ncbi:hypothetical protein ACFFGH_25525 [Lysobacter korlensis]|uniref:DoxX family protein n=1 Tax=Lysobacter korlensis TaxID=553636 RepID=A0ABV6RX86_9GAMM
MLPLIVLISVTLASYLASAVFSRRSVDPGTRFARATAYGLAAMFLFASVGHFAEPLRSGLEAIVPPFVPFPALVVAASGVFEIALAGALLWARSRRWAAIVAFLYLIAVFPANVLAATTVDHPAAPDTPLVLRTVIQLVFLAASGFVALRTSGKVRLGRRSAERQLATVSPE